MSLKEYRAKRNFAQTKEPAGKTPASRIPKALTFVVQKHAATRLHYDFRLEMEGVLKSWAVPKGFPAKRGDRRLAVEVEDHPLEYGGFEGIIPEANYGAGTVMLWDKGTYAVSGDDPLTALKAGKLHLMLHGKKLKGEWTLVRMKPREESAKPQWLLLKSGEDATPLPRSLEDRSVISSRTLDEIAAAKKPKQWQSNRDANHSVTARRAPSLSPATSRARLTTVSRRASSSKIENHEVEIPKLQRLPPARPGFILPMKALLRAELPKGTDWIYEIKFDGIRALAIKDNRNLQLLSRNEKDLSTKYAPIFEALRDLPAKRAVLDGEIVALDPEGRPSFQLLQRYHAPGGDKPPLFYYVFDLLNLDGKDLAGLPLLKRKAMAETLVANLSPVIRFSASIRAHSKQVLREMQARGLEGLIAKQKDSKYEPGRRSGAWVKFKWAIEQEFVIGGFTPPRGTRSHFGAILVGYYEGNKLLFAGKVGTGFDQKLLTSLYQKFQKLARRDCPFANLPEKLAAAGRGLTASQMKLCTWLEPKLVCQIRFAEWTHDRHLRQPAFLGLREDKDPREVVREMLAS